MPKTPKQDPAALEKEAAFLKKWAKGKTITHTGGLFWSAGKWTTMLEPTVVQGLIDLKLVTPAGPNKPMYPEAALAYMTPKDAKQKRSITVPCYRFTVN